MRKFEKYKNIEKLQKSKIFLFVCLTFHVRIESAAFKMSRSECLLFRMKKNLSNKISMSALFQKGQVTFQNGALSLDHLISVTCPLRRHTEDGTRIKCNFFVGCDYRS